MCRNIRTLFNFDPPATEDEIRDGAAQFVRKLSGFTRPSRANEAALDLAIKDYRRRCPPAPRLAVASPPNDREVETSKAHARAAE